MAKGTNVLTIGLDPGVSGWTSVSFSSSTSVHDFDIVFFDPNNVLRPPASPRVVIDGHLYLRGDDSRSTDADLERRREEFLTHLAAGGDLVVFGDTMVAFQLERSMSLSSGWELLETPTGLKSAGGTKVKIVDNGPLGAFLRDHQSEISYRTVFADSNFGGWSTLAVTERTSEGVAALYQSPYWTGRVLYLPWIEIPAGETFWRSLVEAIVASKIETQDAPEWAHDYAGEKENVLSAEIQELEIAIAEASRQLGELAIERQQAAVAKPLLYAQGTELEQAVLHVFEALGGTSVPGKDSNRVDHVIAFEDWVAVIEVKGLKGSAKEENSAQLEKWMTDWATHDNAKPILVVNAHREMDPSERPEAFPHQMLKYATKREHALLTSSQLFVIYEEAQLDPSRVPSLLDEIRTTEGVLSGHDILPYKR